MPTDGRIESILNGAVVGWAWDPSAPDSHVGVAIVVDGDVLTQAVAATFAPGLSEVGVGEGDHAFAIQLPEPVADGRQHWITVVAGRHDDEVPVVDGFPQGGEGGWELTSFVFVGLEENIARVLLSLEDDDGPSEELSTFALAGTDSWLFGLSDAERSPPSPSVQAEHEAAVRTWLDELNQTAAALAQIGLRHVVAVVPSKLAVYREFATDVVANLDLQRPAARLVRLSYDTDELVVCDLLEPLLAAKRHGLLYEPDGATWNARGAFYAHRALLKHVAIPGLTALGAQDPPLAPSTRRRVSELAALPRMAVVDGLLELVSGDDVLESVPGEPSPTADLAILGVQRMPADAHLERDGLPAPRLYVRPDPETRTSALLLGHPCVSELIPWLAEASSRLAVLSTPVAPIEQIELEYPGVVFHVLDERYLYEPPPALPGGTDSAEHVVESVTDQALDSGVGGAAASPVIESERESEGSGREDASS
jgi:hypothetical protein